MCFFVIFVFLLAPRLIPDRLRPATIIPSWYYHFRTGFEPVPKHTPTIPQGYPKHTCRKMTKCNIYYIIRSIIYFLFGFSRSLI